MSDLAWAHSVTVGNQTAKQLLCFLASHGFTALYFKNSTIAKILEVSERAVRAAKNYLTVRGLLTITPQFNEQGRQTSNFMHLNVPKEYMRKCEADFENEGNLSIGGAERSSSLGRNVVPPPPERSSSSPPSKSLASTSIKKGISEKNFQNNKYINNKSNNKSIGEETVDVRPKKKQKRKPETQLPIEFKPNDTHRQLAEELGVDIDRELEIFEEHALANDRRLSDWDAGFRMWLRKAVEFKPKSVPVQKHIQEPVARRLPEWNEEFFRKEEEEEAERQKQRRIESAARMKELQEQTPKGVGEYVKGILRSTRALQHGGAGRDIVQPDQEAQARRHLVAEGSDAKPDQGQGARVFSRPGGG